MSFSFCTWKGATSSHPPDVWSLFSEDWVSCKTTTDINRLPEVWVAWFNPGGKLYLSCCNLSLKIFFAVQHFRCLGSQGVELSPVARLDQTSMKLDDTVKLMGIVGGGRIIFTSSHPADNIVLLCFVGTDGWVIHL